MKYIQVAASKIEGWEVAEDLYSTLAPRLQGDITKYLTSPIVDPDSGDVYFLLDDATGALVGLDMTQALPGYPKWATREFNGVTWVSRHPVNVWEPAAPGIPNTWSRTDGTWVTPTGWKYIAGEDVTEDAGQTWWRATENVAHPPSESPGQYIRVDGQLGDVVPEPTGPQDWEPYNGFPESLYQEDDLVIHNQQTWRSTVNNNSWEPGVFGWVVV